MASKPTYEELEQRIHEITERKQAEGNLWESEARYRTILESIEEAYFGLTLKGTLHSLMIHYL
jgi:PAS domain-containing protein